jgi:hypothetical protein
VKTDFSLPYRINLNTWQMVGLPTGSISIDIYKSTLASYPGTTGINIGGTGPYLSLAVQNSGTTSGWGTPTGAQGDVMRVNVKSASTVTLASLGLNYNSY